MTLPLVEYGNLVAKLFLKIHCGNVNINVPHNEDFGYIVLDKHVFTNFNH